MDAPQSYREAMRHNDADGWVEAIVEEYQNLCQKGVFVRVQPCISNSALFLHSLSMHLQCISKALPHTLTHCVSDSTCYTTLHCPLHLHLCMCHPCLFVCLFPLLDCFH